MKDKTLLNCIDFLTSKGLGVTKKIGKIANNKNTEDNTKIMLKILISLLFIALLDIPFGFLRILGIYVIYNVGTIFRELLSNTWSFVIHYTYAISSLILLYKVIESILKDKELNILELDRVKDKKIKKSIFEPILSIIKILLIIVCIPLGLLVILLIMGLGAYIGLLVKGYMLIGIPFMIIGFIIIFVALFRIITLFINGKGGTK